MKLNFKWEGWEGTRDVALWRCFGRYCRTTQEISNQGFRAPAGTRWRITGKGRRGWDLELVEQCKCCGLLGRVSEVNWRYVVIEGPPPTAPSDTAIESARKLGGDEAAIALVDQWAISWRYFKAQKGHPWYAGRDGHELIALDDTEDNP